MGGLRKQGGAGECGRAGGADVSRAEDELHAKTQSHRCLRYSLEQEGGGKENKNNIKLQAVLTHSPAGHHTVNRLRLDRQPKNVEHMNLVLNHIPKLYFRGVLLI